MAGPIEGVLSAAQRESLEIENFIFHIIDPDSEVDGKVIYLDEVQLEDKTKNFFLDRLRDVAEGTQYVFREDAVHLKEKCEQVAAEPGRFVELSRHITADFAGRHEGQMSAGVFVVATVKYLASPNQWRGLILLVKMDKRPSISYNYKDIGGRLVAVMANVENALNEAKAAIQKSAVVSVTGDFAWDVLAFDRVRRPLLSEYYKAFLGVTERQPDSEWTRITHKTVRHWARSLTSEQMAPGEDSVSYIGRSLNYLQDHATFRTDDFIDAVVRDENPERKANLERMLRDTLAEAGIAGQEFSPKPDSLPKRDRKQTYVTAEGVTITFEGAKDVAGLTIAPDSATGGKIITIRTARLNTK